jgi:glucuronoarabinoxylan endo-1,4-beta-xylanase
MIIQTNRRTAYRFKLKSKFISGLLLLLAGVAGAQNLVTNPGFETGDTSGWTTQGSPQISAQTVQVHSGTYAALVTNRTAAWNGIAQSLTSALQAGQTYNVSAWVRLVSGTNQTFYLTFAKTDGNPTSYAQAAIGTVTSTNWTQISGQYTLSVSGTLSSLVLYCEQPNLTSAYYIDDVVVSNSVGNSPPVGTNGQCTVDWSNVYQRIDGFGASSAWDGSWTAAQADLLFSTNTGCGLSLLRNHITYANSTSATAVPTTVETSIMQMAQARGARVWSTPWTPAVGFKNTNNLYGSKPITNAVDGGSYLGNGNNITNLNYASQLANYVASMKTNYGVNIYALSMQNEPDAQVNTYEACQWSGQQIHDFSTNLFNALAAKGFGSTQIILPESESWSGNPGLYTPTLNDPNSAANVSIIANHNYVADNSVGDQTTPAAINTQGKALWETEVALLSGSDSSINNALYWAGRIHLFMTAAQANAWHYWWLVASDNGGLIVSGVPAKRLYALGQFARFVRPNYYRIGVGSSTGSVQVSAYKDTNSPSFAIVAINSSSMIVTQTFYLANVTGVASVTPWITSATLSLAPQTSVAVAGSSFSYVMPPMSIVTFAGQSSTGSLTLAPVANQTVNAGVTVVITNSASDPNVPPLTLNYSLLQGPAGATLITDGSGTNGIFTWRPPVSQAGTTNPVSVAVTESGGSNLSATNNFTVTVNPLNQPVLGSVTIANGQVNLVVNGDYGPDYTLLTSTDLINWQALYTTNSPLLPVTLVDTNSTDAARFYQIQLGP